MAAGGEGLTWDVLPKNGQEVYFSHDIYEKYSLAPSLSDLLLLSKRNAEANTDRPNPEQENRASVGQESVPVGAKPSSNPAPFQEPRVPYPHVSSLTKGEQRRYLRLLSDYSNVDPSRTDMSEPSDYSQYLQMKEFVKKEVEEFLKFAHNAAKLCSKDYDYISKEALLYSKQFLSSSIGSVKKYPECYTLHDVTSIMGGKFNTELTLKLEAKLLALGKVNLIKLHFPNMPAQIQIPAKLKNKSAVGTPEQRASLLHLDISRDPNAKRLVVKYCPRVVLTSESLFTLLNNHGLNYKDQWELPVHVEDISVTGGKPARVAYIDPPLPKKEMTVREKNQFFHDLLADFHTTKQSAVLAVAATLDKPREDPERLSAAECCPGRQMPAPDSMDIDFDTDVTELETFGSTPEALKLSKLQDAPAKPANSRSKIPLEEHLKMETRVLSEMSRVVGERKNTVSGQSSKKTPSAGCVPGLECKGDSLRLGFESEKAGLSSKRTASVKDDNIDDKPGISSSRGGTEEEPLVIDTECENADIKPRAIPSDPRPVADSSELPRSATQDRPGKAADPSEVPDRETNMVSPKPCPELPEGSDPVGQILKMQTELLKAPSTSCPSRAEASSENCLKSKPGQTPLRSKPTGVVSPEPGQSTATDTATLPKFTWLSDLQGRQKGSFWEALENRSEYEAPEQGSLVYKLFSLDDLLLLVRCPIQKVELRPRYKKKKFRRFFPVYVLPKLEYQSFYGAEALTESEICRLWTESLLHSNSSFVVAHIDALTSKLFLVEELSEEGLKRRFGTFKPANSMNILQHILKKVSGLQEGSYLLAHAAGDSSVTIYRSCPAEGVRGAYNLHAAHSDLPGIPSTLSVPWVPLDPNVVLPCHYDQERVPCTFPPKAAGAQKDQKMSGPDPRPGTPNHRKHVSMETHGDHPPANRFRKRPGAASSKTMRNIYKQANRGPNWKFWNETKRRKDDPA